MINFQESYASELGFILMTPGSVVNDTLLTLLLSLAWTRKAWHGQEKYLEKYISYQKWDKFFLFVMHPFSPEISSVLQMITWVKVSGFLPNLVCALILWRFGFRLLRSKFLQFLTEISASNPSIFSFQDDNLCKYQWIFTKFGMCIEILGDLVWDCQWANFITFTGDNLSKCQ